MTLFSLVLILLPSFGQGISITMQMWCDINMYIASPSMSWYSSTWLLIWGFRKSSFYHDTSMPGSRKKNSHFHFHLFIFFVHHPLKNLDRFYMLAVVSAYMPTFIWMYLSSYYLFVYIYCVLFPLFQHFTTKTLLMFPWAIVIYFFTHIWVSVKSWLFLYIIKCAYIIKGDNSSLTCI